MHVVTGTHTTSSDDAVVRFDFHWTGDHRLNGMSVGAFGIETMFALTAPDDLSSGTLRRPAGRQSRTTEWRRRVGRAEGRDRDPIPTELARPAVARARRTMSAGTSNYKFDLP